MEKKYKYSKELHGGVDHSVRVFRNGNSLNMPSDLKSILDNEVIEVQLSIDKPKETLNSPIGGITVMENVSRKSIEMTGVEYYDLVKKLHSGALEFSSLFNPSIN